MSQMLSLLPQPASAGLLLPQLRCVSMEIRELEEDDDNGAAPVAAGSVDPPRHRDWLSAVVSECSGFLPCYSGQL
jgi:hypothetical protein